MDQQDFASLNEKQQEAVTATEGYVRVIAGAGSGKTRLLVSRYAYLVTEVGIDTANILCVTFTNKAAGEMKKRIRTQIGPGCDTGLICTYHGFCARLLREDGGRLFLNRGFRILDTAGQKSILEEIYRKRELKLDHASFESILKRIGLFKSDIAYVSAMTNPAPCRILPEVGDTDQEIMEEFLQRQKALYALDFHDLISYALYLLETNQTVRQKWQERLNYIMVDEFQDSSRREMRLVDILSGGYGNVMVVGDPDQNIYEWRGSDVRLLVDFDKHHEGTKTVFLNRNYRSTPQILACANTLIDKNRIRIKKDLFTLAEAGAPVIHYHMANDSAEAGQIVNTIRQIRKETGRPWGDFAVLYRSGFLSRTVEKKFTEGQIPYEIFGGVRFWRRMEVQDMVAYLRLIASGDDDAFRRVVNVPRRKFGRSRMAALDALRDGEETPGKLFDTLAAHADDPAFRGSGIADLIRLIREMRQESTGMRISDVVRAVCTRSGYQQYIRELGDEERLENLAEFLRVADEFEKNFGEDLTLPAFLLQVDLQAREGDDSPRDAVKLMTIHASKGLEFPVVFIVGFTEGIFPSSKTVEERKEAGLEEERRLCYVALTRAMERLFLMDSEGFSENGAKKLPSRFLREIGPENYTRIGVISEELDRESRGYAARTTPPASGETDKSAGEVIQHHIFGRGVILSRDDTRGSYIIKFDRLEKPRHIARTYFDTPREPLQATTPDTDGNAAQPLVPAPEPAGPEGMPPPNAAPASVETPIPATEQTMVPYAEIQLEPIPDPVREPDREPERGPVREETPQHGLTPTEQQALREKLAGTENLWKREDVPHSGWSCTGITDLGAPVGVCEMCGEQIIRYVHHMTHPHYHPLGVGCVCAGKMEGDVVAARTREREFKKRQARMDTFLGREWKLSRNGNRYLKVRGHMIVLYKERERSVWRYAIDREFRPVSYPTREEAVRSVFEELEILRSREAAGQS